MLLGFQKERPVVKNNIYKKAMKVLLVCERSGGHFFPAFTLAQEIKKQSSDEVHFFITSSALKNKIKEKGFIAWGRSFSFRNIILEGIWRFFEAIFLTLALRPKRVIGFGGRDSFFLLLWAKLLAIETAIYEPNLTFGKANKALSKVVDRVYCGFKENADSLAKAKFVGIPIREELKRMEKHEAKQLMGFEPENQDKPVIAAVGGSQGSKFINDNVLKLEESLQGDFDIIHLTGPKDYEEISRFYSKIEAKAFVKDFSERMDAVYGAADIIICRAGALTVAEVSYFAIPAVFIPHPQAGSHQYCNAEYLQKAGAAIMFTQDNFSFEDFKNTVKGILTDKDMRQKMHESFRNIDIVRSGHEFYKNIFA